MDSGRFDQVTRRLASALSRRSVARGAVGAASALALGSLVSVDEAGAKKKGCRKNGCPTPNNPCQEAVCKKVRKKNGNHKFTCVTQDRANNTPCGDGSVCTNGRCNGTCDAAGAECTANAACCSGGCTCGTGDEAGLCQGNFAQNFNQNTQGWAGVVRASSGTGGIPAHGGNAYGQAASNGDAFTRLGGYTNVFPADGYKVELWIYLDPANTPVNQVFDYTSALNRPNCSHLRDFNFRVGKAGDGDFCIGASNNAGGPACDAAGNPATITATGWYLFRHTFTGAVGSPVSCKMEVFNAANVSVFSKTISPATDIVGTQVGGNRYAWFPAIPGPQTPFPFIAIDDSSRASL